MGKEQYSELQISDPNSFRVLNLSGKLGFLSGGITFTLHFIIKNVLSY